MSGKQDLVVKMTINSQDFDAGLKNAKAQMNRFGQSAISARGVIDNVVKGMIKSFGALGVAVGGAQMFKSFITSTQTIGDKWNNAMVTAKTSFESFQVAVMTGSNSILSNFRQSIAAANEFAAAMDRLGSAQISNQYARMSFVTPFNEELTKYRNAKQNGDTTGMAFAAASMQRYLQEYQNNSLNILTSSRDVLATRLSSYTSGFVNKNNLNKYLDQLYLELVNGVFPPILQDFRNLDNELAKGDYFYNQAKEEMERRYGPGWQREAEALNALANINDSTLREMLEVIRTYDNVRNEINGMRRQMNRVLNGNDQTTTTAQNMSTATVGLTWEQQMEAIRRSSFFEALNSDRLKDSQIIPLAELIEDEEIFEADTEAVVAAYWARQEAMAALNEEVKMGIQTFAAFGSIMTSIGTIADSDMFTKIGQSLSSIASQASSTISTLMALSGAQTIEGITETFSSAPPFTKIAMTATALAGILGMVATAKSAFAGSYANGGIVPGTSYTGDKLWARVNSGERIIPANDWNNMMRGGGTVKFVIEGSQLKGVLDNYESIEAM